MTRRFAATPPRPRRRSSSPAVDHTPVKPAVTCSAPTAEPTSLDLVLRGHRAKLVVVPPPTHSVLTPLPSATVGAVPDNSAATGGEVDVVKSEEE